MKGLVKKIPVLLTRASIEPNRASAVSTTDLAVSGSAMSPSTQAKRWDALISADWLTLREVATTLYPLSRKGVQRRRDHAEGQPVGGDQRIPALGLRRWRHRRPGDGQVRR